MDELADQHLLRFRILSDQLIAEVERRDGAQPVRSATWPTVADVAAHVTSIYRWVAEIFTTGAPSARVDLPRSEQMRELREARDTLRALLEADDVPCWIIGGSTGTTAFWRRRMVLETMKHLLDVRTTPDDRFAVQRELDAALAVDGIDEFFDVFLARSRATLAPLPGSLRLVATDVDRSWRIAPDRYINDDEQANAHDLADPPLNRRPATRVPTVRVVRMLAAGPANDSWWLFVCKPPSTRRCLALRSHHAVLDARYV